MYTSPKTSAEVKYSPTDWDPTGDPCYSGERRVPEFAVIRLDLLQRYGIDALLELLHVHVVLRGCSLWTLQGLKTKQKVFRLKHNIRGTNHRIKQ